MFQLVVADTSRHFPLTTLHSYTDRLYSRRPRAPDSAEEGQDDRRSIQRYQRRSPRAREEGSQIQRHRSGSWVSFALYLSLSQI